MSRAARLRPYGSPKFALFGETLLTGLAVAIASIPIVTAVPAIVAGARHLRRHHDGRADGLGDLARDVGFAVRRLWGLGVGAALVAAFLVLDAWALAALDVPGSAPVAAVLALAALAGVVVILRFAGAWDPAAATGAQLRRAAAESAHDALGTTLLLLAVAGTGVLVWMFPPLTIVAGGVLALAAYAVDSRLEALVAGDD